MSEGIWSASANMTMAESSEWSTSNVIEFDEDGTWNDYDLNNGTPLGQSVESNFDSVENDGGGFLVLLQKNETTNRTLETPTSGALAQAAVGQG